MAEWWPKLESFTLEGCCIRAWGFPGDQSSAFDVCRNLRSLSLDFANGWDSLVAILADLPPSLRTLRLATSDLYAPAPTHPAFLHFAKVAHQLTQLAFVRSSDHNFYANDLGILDPVITKLSAVERLTVDVHAVEPVGLAAALAPLDSLVELVFVEVASQTMGELAAAEVIGILEGSSSLRKLTLCPLACAHWSADKRGRVERAAATRNISLIWT